MPRDVIEPLVVEVLGLSRDFLEQAWLVLKEEPGMKVELRQDGIEALARPDKAAAPDVLIMRKTTRADSFYQILGNYIQSHPTVRVILSAPYKDPDMMIQALRVGVKEFLFEPFQPGEIAAVVRRLGGQSETSGAPRRARVLAFLPCKGGSGATFLAANLANILAEHFGRQVLFVDLNLQFGDAYLYLMDHSPDNTLGEVCRNFVRFDHKFLESASIKLPSGLRLLAAPDSPADAELVKPEHIESIVAVAREHFDFIVLDVGRVLDAVTLKALDLADEVMPVLQLTLPSVRDAQRMNGVFNTLHYTGTKLRWIVNRSDGKADLVIGDVERVLGKPVHKVPNDHKHVEASVNQGIPIEQLHPHSPVGKALVELAGELQPEIGGNHAKKHWYSFGG